MKMYKYFILVFLNTFNMSLGIDCNPNTPYIHLQNMKDELFMMKYGYWVKASDKLETVGKKFQYLQNKHEVQVDFKYQSKYPDIILQKKDDPPHFNFDNIEYHTNPPDLLHIQDKNDNNTVRYKYIKYITDYRPNIGEGTLNQIIVNNDLVHKQLESRIRSLEAMIYLFENSLI